jgi:hypothetical protein
VRAKEAGPLPVTRKTRADAREIEATIKAAVAQAITDREKLKSDPDPIKVGSGNVGKVIFTLVLILFLGSCIYNYLEMKALNRPVDFTLEQRIDAMDVYLYMLQSRVRDFQASHGMFPAALAEVGMPDNSEVDYLVTPDGEFRLSYRVGSVVRTYGSNEAPGRLLQGEFTRAAFRGRVPSSPQ